LLFTRTSRSTEKALLLNVLVIFCIQDDEEAVLEGEKEAEKMIVEAYSALLLAFLSTERYFSFSILSYMSYPF